MDDDMRKRMLAGGWADPATVRPQTGTFEEALYRTGLRRIGIDESTDARARAATISRLLRALPPTRRQAVIDLALQLVESPPSDLERRLADAQPNSDGVLREMLASQNEGKED